MKNSLTLLLLIFSNNLFAQNIVIKEPCPNHRPGSPNREAAHSYFDQETNKLYLTYMDKTKLYLKAYVDMVKTEEYAYARTEDAGLFNQVSDVVLNDQKEYHLLFANPSCAEFSVQSINLLDKSIKRYPQALILKKDEFYLYSFSDGGNLFVFTAIKKTSSTRLYKYNFGTGVFDAHVLNFEAISFPGTSKVIHLWNIISDDKTVAYDNPDVFRYSKNASAKSIVDPKVVSRAMKFYQPEGHLVVTVDGYNNRTYIIDIDLATNTFQYDDVEFEKIGALSNETQKNSYLFENVLLQVKVSDEKLLASVVDLKTKQRIQSFSCAATDSTINFANTPIVKLTTEKSIFGTNESEKEIKSKKIKRTLRVFSENNVFISAIRNEDKNIEIMIGSYYVNMVSTPGMMSPGGAMSGGSSTPVEYLYFFKSLLSKDFSRRMPGYLDDSFYEKLLDKKKEIKCPSKAQTIFSINTDYYLGYFYSIYPNAKEGEVEDYYYVEKFGSK